MGMGNSRLNAAEGEVVPAKIRPMLIGRFEELRKRRNVEGTLSKKQLLKDADEEDGNSQSSHETETEDKVSSPKEIQPPEEEMVMRAITTEKLSRVVPVPNSECEIEENNPNKGNLEKVNKDIDPNQDKAIHTVEMAEAEIKTEEGKTVEPVEEPKREIEQEVGAKGDDNDDDDSDDGDESEEVDRYLCPGSPSFRIYCIETEKREEEECKNPTIIMHQKSRSAESVESAASRNLNEVLQIDEIESTTKRKGNKKKFGAVKTLFKVKSCYHPMCTCTGDGRSRLVTAKAAK